MAHILVQENKIIYTNSIKTTSNPKPEDQRNYPIKNITSNGLLQIISKLVGEISFCNLLTTFTYKS